MIDLPAPARQAIAMRDRPFVLDVSRLIWRLWSGRLPTGIDRVCLAYAERFADRSCAAIQRKASRRILSPALSDELFALLTGNRQHFRRRLSNLLVRALGDRGGVGDGRSRIFLNVGHTGLDAPGLSEWLAERRLRAVFMIHDLIPISHPEFCRAGELDRHRLRMDNALRSAAGIIANSAATAAALADYAGERGLIVPPHVTAWIAGPDPVARPMPSVLDRPWFVSLGTIEGRKNHVLLLHLWRRLAKRLGERTPLLILIGQRGWEAQAAFAMLDRQPDIAAHVRELNQCSDAELAGYLAGARALLMPSFVEGFGLPVVEAMQQGTPVIASDLPVFREIAGDVPLYCDPLDGPAWERAVLQYMTECSDRTRQIEATAGYVAPDWPTHFATVERWLETLPG